MIYLDNAATTPVSDEVLQAMLPYFCTNFGNASALYTAGRTARKAVDNARRQCAAALHAEPNEIYFTSCGSESDNWAIRGAAYARKDRGNHIITTVIEHHAVLHTCAQLEKEGFRVTYLPVDRYGLVTPEQVEAAITPETTCISIMAANNEIGTVEPVAAIGAIARERDILFHTDAVQAAAGIPLDVNAMHIDLLSISGHKLHAPKGVGLLYIRKGMHIDRLIHGGAQERGQRAGTENVPYIIGLGRAMETASAHMAENIARVTELRERLIGRILSEIPESSLNGHPTERLPGNVNVSFRKIEGESLLLNLDMRGIAASSGSACTAGATQTSHVLQAIGLGEELARGSLRLSLSDTTTREEIDTAADALCDIVARLRAALR